MLAHWTAGQIFNIAFFGALGVMTVSLLVWLIAAIVLFVFFR